MKAVTEDVRTGRVEVINVPEPELRPGGILVRTAFSAISAGTERAKIETGEKSLLGKALARPDQVKQVIELGRSQGISAAYHKVKSRLDSLSPLGYSNSGRVIEVSDGVEGFRLGDRVACGGAGFANHAEVNFVPANLAVHIPDNVSLESASFTTIGAIAMQGLRQADLRFGETVVVLGVGLIGLISVALAKLAGCSVVAADSNPVRAEFAKRMGADLCISSSDAQIGTLVKRFSRHGADAIVITAATPSSEPLELGTSLLRDRGRVVIVGDVGMNVSRRTMYDKELSLAMSRSYGPGRYDVNYEERGIDYPVGYVRWTERRNMEAFVSFLADGALDLSPVLTSRFPLDEAESAYADIREHGSYTALLEYSEASQQAINKDVFQDQLTESAMPSRDIIRVGCIGAGGFARDMIIPTLRKLRCVTLQNVATSTGITAESARRMFKFAKTCTPSELLEKSDTDLVFVTSRHDTHAEFVVRALNSGKAVFVEKPLGTSRAELREIENAYQSALRERRPPFLMVGFNRRFAPFTEKLKSFFGNRQEPMLAHVRVNAGYLPQEHWTHQSGGRIVGELCHFIDWSRFVIGKRICSVSATALPDGARYTRDNVSCTVVFEDGSIANILYLANGDKSVPKEYFEVFCEGSVARLNDFLSLSLTRNGKTKELRERRDKGHSKELTVSIESLLSNRPAPINFAELLEVSLATLAVRESIEAGKTLDMHRSSLVAVEA
jgi:predicted dehydrogenase/threonine dehydrogenase-like Zn-dependent dehydrogenase